MAYKRSFQIMVFDFQSDLVGRSADESQIAYCLDVKLPFTYISGVWTPSARVNVKKSLVVINGKATGATKIYTTESASLNFYPTMVIFRASNISGVTLKPTVSVGTNSTAYDNIVSAGLLPTLLSALSANSGAPQIASISLPIAGGVDIYANVSIAGLATNYSFMVEIVGFYDT